MSTIKNLIKGTGSYEVKEVVHSGNQVPSASSNFETDGTSWWNIAASNGVWNESTKDWTITGTGGYNTITASLTPSGYYKVSFKAKSSNLTTPIYGVYSSAGYISVNSNPNLTTEYQNYSFEGYMTSSKIIFITSNASLFDGKNITIDDIKYELLTPEIGTKYIENTIAGTTALPIKTAHGEWEFDINKGNSNVYNFYIISSDLIGTSSYRFYSGGVEVVRFYKDNGVILATSAGYIDPNTDYRIKIARLKSAGVFKDIPTLQTSDLVNGTGDYGMSSFTSYGRYGFSASSNTGVLAKAGTADEISVISGQKFLVEFDVNINSGSGLKTAFFTSLSSAARRSNEVFVQQGRNNVILTSTYNGDVTLEIFSEDDIDFEISGLKIRRIYDADTFAIFIKGGDFGTNTWTLVDPTGGTGTNPFTDSTYTTSEFIVLDLDSGDSFGNLIIHNEVEQ